MFIVRNAIETPDGTILESFSRNDYKTYIDANGEEYMVDGGDEYARRNINKVPAKELTVTEEDNFEVIREHLTWGTYGKNGDQPLRYIPLCEMEDDHIKAIFDDGYCLHPFRRQCMEKELKLRSL